MAPDINLISNVPKAVDVNEPRKTSAYALFNELNTAVKAGGVKLYTAGKGVAPLVPGTGYHNCAGVRGAVGANAGKAGICVKVDGGEK